MVFKNRTGLANSIKNKAIIQYDKNRKKMSVQLEKIENQTSFWFFDQFSF